MNWWSGHPFRLHLQQWCQIQSLNKIVSWKGQKTPFPKLSKTFILCPITTRQPLAAPGDHRWLPSDHLVTTWYQQIAWGHHLATIHCKNSCQNSGFFHCQTSQNWNFPALFSTGPWWIGSVLEINLPDYDPDQHRKFHCDRPRQLGLVRNRIPFPIRPSHLPPPGCQGAGYAL